ncbi:unnamed protein product [Acanthoscelides obtectus]|uniref:RING-type domain-containing protein n=1 Tax=Acanthoscelides obtectus TaxID=200917 RepID=A0A9P0K3U0_ACAOB|nr:unnamed protein product [Acanthoscelides obtectus]CAK1643695.1 Putative E3 ubiquitin-protein ligase SINAT1 [Acanthoscelides obtectus]
MTNLPRYVMQNLKCSICGRYLSVPPVSGPKGKYTCGRCRPNVEASGPYEEIAKHILFPCSNEDCKSRLKWGEVLAHEYVCQFRKTPCPFPTCYVRLFFSRLFNHFNEVHKSYVHNRHCNITLNFSQAPLHLSVHCYSYSQTVFLVFVKTATNWPMHTFSFALAALPNSDRVSLSDKQYAVNLYLNSTAGNAVIKKIGEVVPQYDIDKHCLPCITGKCNKSWHQGENFLDVTFEGIDANYYYNDIKCIVKVDKSTSLAERLECPVCKNYMINAIFICPTGHSLCGKCKAMITTCPLCKCGMGSTRNYTLEEVAETLEVPCHNDFMGCVFVGSVAETIQHEANCSFQVNTATDSKSAVSM